jgi:phosphate transport system substrate-binding protein
MKKLLLAGLLGLATLTAAHAADSELLINGAGATFPYPIYSKWFDAYAKVDTSVKFNYQSIGSGGGQQQILAGTVDFGASDGPMSDENLAKAPSKLLHIPTVAGADVVSFNLAGVTKLKLDGPTLANIFLGKITKWNDPAIVGQNPDAKLPDQNIIVVHRSDGSGTTYIFVDYLANVSKDWLDTVGKPNTSVKWPTGVGGKGNEGVAGLLSQVPGSLGYVELAYAMANKLPYADMKNSSGKYITATLDSISEAMATATIPDDFRFSMVNPPGEKAYPISGCTWLLVYQQQKDPVKGKKLVEFLKWAFNDGQKMANTLNYASLPDSVIQRVLKRIDEIKY